MTRIRMTGWIVVAAMAAAAASAETLYQRNGDVAGTRAESGKAGPGIGPTGGEPSCEGQTEGAKCWKELASHPGCFVWDEHYYADQTVTWSGGCSDGLSSGTGTLTWVRDGKEDKHSGLLQEGKRQGHWVIREANGTVGEGPFVRGKRNGYWVLRKADGSVREGPWVDNKQHGRWVIRSPDGRTYTINFGDGERQ